MPERMKVGILGATGMVGQKLIMLLADHPWFEVAYLAASEQSAGKTYRQAVMGRWMQNGAIPKALRDMKVHSAERHTKTALRHANVFFSAMDADADLIRGIETHCASLGAHIITASSAHRWDEDVPLIIPELNPHHLEMVETQRKLRGWKGSVVAKPNCSIQSYLPVLHAWQRFHPLKLFVATYQAVSGAGRTLSGWPEMANNGDGNIIPYIKGEEEKSEREPMKIWAEIVNGRFVLPIEPVISATCVRVPVSDGHLAAMNIRFRSYPSKEDLIRAIREFKNPLDGLSLPSAPQPFMQYLDDDDRPQSRLDRDFGNGMGISVGRLRKDTLLRWNCVALSHNTIRGAAGGMILAAELMKAKGYLE